MQKVSEFEDIKENVTTRRNKTEDSSLSEDNSEEVELEWHVHIVLLHIKMSCV